MPTYYDSSGKPYELSIEIGRGGEGTVFYCPNDSNLVAKIYHEPIDEEKAEKLRWMAAHRNDQLLKVSAWIIDTLHDRAGYIVGFVMPNVKAKEIHELYSLKSRRVHFPEATWQFLLHAATNVARAFYVLHKNDHIMGDVNHGNCVVLADGTVKLIDCDSYSIKTDKMRYRCDVGVATHLAPELQGIDLGEIEREKIHDNFGLAVIIFQLLFLGRHPFAGNYLGAEDKSLEDCIREYRFAYANEKVTRVKQPPGTLSLSQLSPRVADLFKKAFFTHQRPEAREWIEALEDLSKSLKQCPVHIGHYFFKELLACPWCEIESKTGLLLFPFVSGKEIGNEFNILTVEKLLASLEMPQNLPENPVRPFMLPPPTAESIEVAKKNRNVSIGLGIIEFWLVLVFSIAAPGCGFVLGILVMALFLAIRHSFVGDGLARLKKELADSKATWEYFQQEWQVYQKDKEYMTDIVAVRQKVKDYQSLLKIRQSQTKQLEDVAFQHQLTDYLQSFDPSEADILGITDENAKSFKRFGLKTAADINEWRLNSFGFDDKTKDLLLRWRRKLEGDFEFDPDIQPPKAEPDSSEIEFSNKRRKIEKEIEQFLVILRSASTTFRQQQQQITTRAAALAQKLVQAESNFAQANSNILFTIILIVIPVFVPLVVSSFQNASKPYPTTDMGMVNRRVEVVARPVNSSDTNTYVNADPNFKVNENITDKQIAEMSANERYNSAEALHNQANKLIDKKDFKKAEKKLRLAVKFIDYDTAILYSLSSLLYDQNKYEESIQFLEKSLRVDPENENAKLLIGANYLKMDQYEKAEDYLTQVVNRHPSSYEANFNLGLVNKKTNSYAAAAVFFGKAVQADPDNIDAIFEYGECLYKTSDFEGGNKQYEKLLELNQEKAKKLRQIRESEQLINPPRFVVRDAKPTP